MKETLIEVLATFGVVAFIFSLLLGFIILIFFLYDVWQYDLKFIVKEYVFRKLNKRKGK